MDKSKVGQFFLLIGVILLVIFFASDVSQSLHVGYFFSGVLMGGLGIYLMVRHKKPAPQSGRFRMLRRRSQEDEEENEEGE